MEHTEDLIPTSPRLDDSSDDVVIERPPVVFNIKPEVAALGVNAFDDLPLNAKVLEAVAKIGWTTPTPVQKPRLPISSRRSHGERGRTSRHPRGSPRTQLSRQHSIPSTSR